MPNDPAFFSFSGLLLHFSGPCLISRRFDNNLWIHTPIIDNQSCDWQTRFNLNLMFKHPALLKVKTGLFTYNQNYGFRNIK